MRNMTRIAAMAVLVLGVAAMLQPANAICSSPRQITSGYSYVYTPGCGGSGCGSNNSSLTDDATGTFWAIGDGNAAPGVGIDNGTFPPLGGWVYIYPGYAAVINSTWAADAGIDGCIDFAADPQRCMAVLLMDNDADTGEGAFALITDEPDALGNYNLEQEGAGPINLVTVSALSITGSVNINDFESVDVSVDGVSLTDIEAGLYLDANCPQPSGGGLPGVIQGYQVFSTDNPSDNNAGNWTPRGPVTPLGDPSTVNLPCTGDTVYITTRIVFQSNFSNVWLSGSSTPVACSATLADPDGTIDIERKPRNREKPRSRTKGR